MNNAQAVTTEGHAVAQRGHFLRGHWKRNTVEQRLARPPAIVGDVDSILSGEIKRLGHRHPAEQCTAELDDWNQLNTGRDTGAADSVVCRGTYDAGYGCTVKPTR